MDITPDKSLIKKLGYAGYTTEQALAELVDNSIDARLPDTPLLVHVTLDFAKKAIRVEDTGSGMDAEGLRSALTIAKGASDDGRLGKFGMGMKSACSHLGRTFALHTRMEDMDDTLTVEYDESEWLGDETRDWTNFKVGVIPSGTLAAGTRIRIEQLNVPLYPNQAAKIREIFGIRYGPYLRDGQVKIQINTRMCEPAEPQLLDGSRQELTIQLSQGRSISGWIGLLKKRSIKGNYGIHTYRKGRLIRAFDKMGVRTHPSVAMLIGELRLDHVPVNFHKTGFIEDSMEYKEAVDAFATCPAVAETLKKIPPVHKTTDGDILSVLIPAGGKEHDALDMRIGAERSKSILERIGDVASSVSDMRIRTVRNDIENGSLYRTETDSGQTTLSIDTGSSMFEPFKNPLFLLGLIRIEADMLSQGDRNIREFVEERNRRWSRFVESRLPSKKAVADMPKRRSVSLAGYGLSPKLASLHDRLKDEFPHSFTFTALSTLSPYLHNYYPQIIYSIHTPLGGGLELEELAGVDDSVVTLRNPHPSQILTAKQLQRKDIVMIRECGENTRDTWAKPEAAWLDLYSEAITHHITPYAEELEYILDKLVDRSLLDMGKLRALARRRRMKECINTYL